MSKPKPSKHKPTKLLHKTSFRVVASLIIFAFIAVFGYSFITGNKRDGGVGSSFASALEPSDFNNDNKVDIFDLSYLLGKWNTTDSQADLTTDGTVNVFDLSRLLSRWGSVGSYPAAGSVGYLGDTSSLKIIDSNTQAPEGTFYNSQYGYLQVNADNITLDHVYVKGCVDYNGSGKLTITNSIIEGGYGTWCIVAGRNPSVIEISDSTIRWRSGSNPDAGSGAGSVMAMADITLLIYRNDISGNPDGVQVNGSNNIIEYNYIHNLAMIGSYPNNTHNDGMQVFNAVNTVIRYNRIDLNGFDGTHQNAAIFFQGDNFPNPQIYGNYLNGGGYVLRLEANVVGAIVRDNTFAPIVTGQYGYYNISGGATVQVWSNNLTTTGQQINYP